jgi:hypothetical protein
VFTTVPLQAESETELISFEIEDQFKQKHTDAEFTDSVVITLGGNKGGKDFVQLWSEALKDSLAADSGLIGVKLVSIADMRGVPFFLKGMIRGKLPQQPEHWMLLDWKGKFPKAYEWTKGICNILVFDRFGVLQFRDEVTDIDPVAMSELMTATRALLRE